jgi:hypothetical protein
LFVYYPVTAEGAKVPGPIEFGRGVDVIAAAMGASVWAILDGITKSRVSQITIAEAVNMTTEQAKVLGKYLLNFVEAEGEEVTADGRG